MVNTHFCCRGQLACELQLCLVQHSLPCLKIYEVNKISIKYQDLQKKIGSQHNEFMQDKPILFEWYLQISPPISLTVLHPKLICNRRRHQIWLYLVTQLVIQESLIQCQKTHFSVMMKWTTEIIIGNRKHYYSVSPCWEACLLHTVIRSSNCY